MEADGFWWLFCATGQPLAYVLYRESAGRDGAEA